MEAVERLLDGKQKKKQTVRQNFGCFRNYSDINLVAGAGFEPATFGLCVKVWI
jgi:hypothetical protein